jgi:hypothetical protein
MSAPGKLVRSSRWRSSPSKGQRPLGNECCVTAGDNGYEAYTAIAWGVGLSLAMCHGRLSATLFPNADTSPPSPTVNSVPRVVAMADPTGTSRARE